MSGREKGRELPYCHAESSRARSRYVVGGIGAESAETCRRLPPPLPSPPRAPSRKGYTVNVQLTVTCKLKRLTDTHHSSLPPPSLQGGNACVGWGLSICLPRMDPEHYLQQNRNVCYVRLCSALHISFVVIWSARYASIPRVCSCVWNVT